MAVRPNNTVVPTRKGEALFAGCSAARWAVAPASPAATLCRIASCCIALAFHRPVDVQFDGYGLHAKVWKHNEAPDNSPEPTLVSNVPLLGVGSGGVQQSQRATSEFFNTPRK